MFELDLTSLYFYEIVSGPPCILHYWHAFFKGNQSPLPLLQHRRKELFSQSQLAEKGDVSSLASTSVSYEIPVSLLHDECSRYPPPPLIILAPQPIFTKPIKYVSRELVHYFIILRPFLITLNLIIKHNKILLDMESH